jgi:hypothetical protein
MGFNSTATTTTIVAKLTPIGRQRLISTNNALISSFSLGDSDANYYTSLPLNTGEIPALAGEIGPSNTINNSVTSNMVLRSLLMVNSNGVTKKSVESQSINILSETSLNGLTTLTGSSLNKIIIDRNNYNTDNLVNLFYSFGLPLNSVNDNLFTGTTNLNGGFSDTAYSALAKTSIVVLGISNDSYGEMIDGKSINIVLPTSAGTYTIYSTFQNKSSQLNTEDARYNETSIQSAKISNNIAFLFSDDIMRPNGGDSSLSWATGSNTNKPFSTNQKQLFNYQTNSNLTQTADTIVGVAYLDKGIIVLTDSTIVNAYTGSSSSVTSATSVTFNSISTSIFQNITCIADRGEFGASTNTTIGNGDSPRISEIGLYDNLGNLIAIAKPDKHIVKNVNEFLALGIKINL